MRNESGEQHQSRRPIRKIVPEETAFCVSIIACFGACEYS
jgi:hypothetical protein